MPDNPSTRNDGKRTGPGSIFRIGILFCLATIAGNVVSYLLTRNGQLHFFELLNAKAAFAAIRLTGLPATINQNVIYLKNSVWLVDTECTAINLIVTFTAFIVVYPSSLRAKLIGIGTGVPFIFAANAIRLLGMAWIDHLAPEYSGYFHDYLWQVVFLIMVAMLWVIWIDTVVRAGNGDKVAEHAPGTDFPA